MKQIIHLDINGEAQDIAVEPYHTLLQVLRDELGLIGAKKGCDTGGCGCCTVLVNGKAVYSCMVFAMTAQGKTITTVEGLADGATLDPVQQAFIEAGAVQCGYCTCGMIMSAKAYLSSDGSHLPGDLEMRQAIAGNLCRCTGYQKIVDAIRLAASRRMETSAKG
ncbi:MAG: (2Fe-2S)-binding protein [Acidobacteriia bacterium]|nr:(2Fe-2S)-binding protein [Terriglobia bacterium]